MRVMQVIYSFGIGGSEIVARDIALNMRHDTVHSVVALEFDGPLRQTLENEGVRTWVINRHPDEYLGPMLRIWRAIRDFKPDVVHTHHLYQLFYTWPGALCTGARIVHTEHECYSLLEPKSCFRLRQLARFCKIVTGVNSETSSFLREKVGISLHKVHTVANGINLNRYGHCRLSRVALGLTVNNLVVGIVARLDEVKDHPMLLRAFRIVAEKLPQASLLIIGDGPRRPQLEQLAGEFGLGEKVRFLGARFDVPDLLSCIDVMVLSSRMEGLPLSILEAMAALKPVVATDVGGVSAVVRPGETGLLVPAGDSEAMALALISLLADSDKANQMGRNGRRLIEQNYDLEKTLSKYISLYEAAVN